MAPLISVIIPTYNPDTERLKRVFLALKEQSLPISKWETLVINNASQNFPQQSFFNKYAPRNTRVIEEPSPGLSYARICGFLNAKSDIAVLVDDDNVLSPNYLECAISELNVLPRVGILGGRISPEFSFPPPEWIRPFYSVLALRDFGSERLVSLISKYNNKQKFEYPYFAPIGAGMILRRGAWNVWLQLIDEKGSIPPDRQGGNLSSGGDNDIVLSALTNDWECAYSPTLSISHLIPANRLTVQYLAKLHKSTSRDNIRILRRHDLCPWPKISKINLVFRLIYIYITMRPWSSNASYIRWCGAVNHFKELSNSNP